MYNPPEYVDATASIENLIVAIRNSLQLWLDIHTNPKAWSQEWNIDDDWHYMLEVTPKIENNYFSFDVKRAVLEVYAEDNLKNMYKCKRCGSLWDAGYEDCNCENQEYTDDDYEQLTETDLEYFIDWLDDIGGINENMVSEWMIQEAMETKGFAVYQEALENTISSIVEDVQEAIKKFDAAENNADLLQCALIASSILHVNGNIVSDYSERTGLDYDTVCKYRDNGIIALFSKEEINQFMQSDRFIYE